jgi:hypothetical protein
MQYGGGDVAPFTVTIWGGGELCELHATSTNPKEARPRTKEERRGVTPLRAPPAGRVARKKRRGYARRMAFPENLLARVVKPVAGGAAGYRAPADMLTPDDAERILEIACMTVASDGHVAGEELAAAQTLGTHLRAAAGTSKPVTAAEVQALAGRCAALGSRDAQTDRLRALSDALSGEGARHLAYKVATAIAMADLASTDAEFEFDIDLLDALHLANDVADRLAGEVHEALTAED